MKRHAQHENVLEVACERIEDLYRTLCLFYPNLIRRADAARDVKTLRARFAAEGLGYLTITLPKMGEEYDGILTGRIAPRTREFLRPVWLHVAQVREYALRTRTCTAEDSRIIKMVRSIFQGFKKLEAGIDPVLLQGKIDEFVRIEDDLSHFYLNEMDPVLNRARDVMHSLFAVNAEGKCLNSAVSASDSEVKYHRLTCKTPKHGPGAVADRKKHNEKWDFTVLFESLHSQWPYYEYHYGIRCTGLPPEADGQNNCLLPCKDITTYPSHLLNAVREYRELVRVPTPANRMCAVPKDSRGPRLIACEHSELMWVQQGVASDLQKYIERHPLTKGHVNFVRQDINATLAAYAASDNSLATIDLKDASDRVSVKLVEWLFPSGIAKQLLALRSTDTALPNGQLVRLSKFASMGSAVCFPVEALVFWALSVAATWQLRNTSLHDAKNEVYVYGDDIIVTNDIAPFLIEQLERAGLVVNRAKSFYGEEYFRESCGVDAFMGEDITPLRIKKLPPLRPTDGDAVLAWLQYASNCWAIFPTSAKRMVRDVEDLLGQPIPLVPFAQGFLSVVVPSESAWKLRDYLRAFPRTFTWNRTACYFCAKMLTSRTPKHESALNSWSRLLLDLTVPQESDPTVVVERSTTIIQPRKCNITCLGGAV